MTKDMQPTSPFTSCPDKVLRQDQSRKWLEENQRALVEYNRRIEERGTFSDGLRKF